MKNIFETVILRILDFHVSDFRSDIDDILLVHFGVIPSLQIKKRLYD